MEITRLPVAKADYVRENTSGGEFSQYQVNLAFTYQTFRATKVERSPQPD